MTLRSGRLFGGAADHRVAPQNASADSLLPQCWELTLVFPYFPLVFNIASVQMWSFRILSYSSYTLMLSEGSDDVMSLF